MIFHEDYVQIMHICNIIYKNLSQTFACIDSPMALIIGACVTLKAFVLKFTTTFNWYFGLPECFSCLLHFYPCFMILRTNYQIFKQLFILH